MNGNVFVKVSSVKEIENIVTNHGMSFDDLDNLADVVEFEDSVIVELEPDDWSWCGEDYYTHELGSDFEPLSYEAYMKKYGHTEFAEKAKEDNINHPTHYNSYSFEVIDIIDEVVPHYSSSYAGNIQNAIKYIFRAPFKGTLRDDLKKAVWYLNHAIDIIDKENSDDEQSNTTK